jgi:phosphohistidine phosphatase
MKRLFVMRHAKSDWDASFDSDHERPLNERGESSARALGLFLAHLGQMPDRILTSTAVRARTTVEIAAQTGAWPSAIVATGELYESSALSMLDLLHRQDNGCDSLLLAGHEPTSSDFVGRLAGEAKVKMVTASLARLDLAVQRWSEVEWGHGTLAWLVTPKLLAAAAKK